MCSVYIYIYIYIYINVLSDNIESNVKLFADNTSMFSVVRIFTTSLKLSKDIDKVGLWDSKWKMSFNPDPSKQTQKVIFFAGNKQNISPMSSI